MAGTQLGLCWGTVPRASLLTQIDAAVEAGYTTISVSPEQYAGAQRSPSELRARLDDSGIAVEAVDPALTWLPGLPATARRRAVVLWRCRAHRRRRGTSSPVDQRGRCASRSVVGGEITRPSQVLSAQAAEAGVGVLLEFVPWSTVGDLSSAARVVRECGAPTPA